MTQEKWIRFILHGDGTATFTDFSGDKDKKVFLDDLPTDIKGKMAVLKLIPINEQVENIGVRLQANVYYVLL